MKAYVLKCALEFMWDEICDLSYYVGYGVLAAFVLLILFPSLLIDPARLWGESEKCSELTLPKYSSIKRVNTIYGLPYTQEDMYYLALNVFYESRNQGIEGMRWVAHVPINRTWDHRFPNSIKSVITQAERNRHGDILVNRCQFSWYCDGESEKPHQVNKKMWLISIWVACNEAMKSYDPTNGALFYHADYVKPKWRNNMIRLTQVGNHIYYRPHNLIHL